MPRHIPAIALLLLSPILAPAQDQAAVDVYAFNGPGKVSPAITSVVERFGGRVDWSPQGWIAMDSQWESGDQFQIWILRPDGSERRALTRGHARVGRFSNGNPAWHPRGGLLVFQSADAEVPRALADRPGWKALTNPGAGVGNNLWLIRADGAKAWKLTGLGADQGVLHPHFSHAGDRLLWAELAPGKPRRWLMRLVDFSLDEEQGPRLANTRTLTPGAMRFYETHGFLPDDSGFLYSATKQEGDYRRLEIYRYDIASGRATPLTDPAQGAWDEHAHVSPDGRRIIWMSSQGIPQEESPRSPLAVKTDYWVMNADGGGKTRLTYFNDPQAPEYRRSWNIASDVAWSPDGRHVMGYLQQLTLAAGRRQHPGTLVRIELPPSR